MDGSNKLTIKEFMLLFKHLEPAHYKESFLFELFQKFSDVKEEEQQALSLSKFSELCFSLGFFKLETQYKFLGIS